MKKLTKSVISILLAITIVVGLVPVMTSMPALAIDDGAVTINPLTGLVTAEFAFEYRQRVNVILKVDGVPRGYLAVDTEVPGEKTYHYADHSAENDPYFQLPRSINPDKDYGLQISLAQGAGKTVRFTWDGTMGGYYILPSAGQTYVVVELVIQPLGYPEKSSDDPSFENWTWSQRTAYQRSITVMLDYGAPMTPDWEAEINGIDGPPPGGVIMGPSDNSDFPTEADDRPRANPKILAVAGSPSDEVVSLMLEYMSAPGRALEDVYLDFNGLDIEMDFYCADPVNMIDGSFFFTYQDMRLEGTIPLTFMRAYNSRADGGSLGKNFTHGYDYKLVDDNGAVCVYLPAGEEVWFLDIDGTNYMTIGDQHYSMTRVGGGYTMLRDNGTQFVFDGAGKLTTVKNPVGTIVASLSYSGGDLTQITGIAGTINLTWSGGHITEVADSFGRAVTYAYSGNNLTSVTNPDGDMLTYNYDGNGFLSVLTDFDGQKYLENTYDSIGRVTAQTLWTADVSTSSTFSYNDASKVNTYTNPDGMDTEFYYDRYRQIVAIKDDTGFHSANTWDDSGNPITLTDSDGNITANVYNGTKVTKATLADGTFVELSYTPAGRLSTVKYPDGGTVTFTYDGNGNVATHTDQLGATTEYTYNALGMITREAKPLGVETNYTYDSAGRVESISDAEGGLYEYTYDGIGRIESMSLKLNASENAVTSYTYSAAGKLERVTDPMGYVTEYTYTPNGFNTSIKNVVGSTDVITRTEYGLNGQVLKTIDANGNATLYEYESSTGRLSSVTNPEGGKTEYTYDEKGRIETTTDPMGVVTEQTYDEQGRVIATTGSAGNSTDYTYDETGRTATVTDALGTVLKYEYEDRLLKSVTEDFGGINAVTRYTYDKAGNILTTTDPEGGVTTNIYDILGRLKSTKDAENRVTRTEYDKNGRILSSFDGENNETQYVYDLAGRLTKSIDARGNATEYSYDKNGNMLTSSDALGNYTYFEYDELGQMTKEILAGQTLNDVDDRVTQYFYDPAGSLLRTVAPNGGTMNYTYDRNGACVSVSDPMGVVTRYSYDLAGRQTRVENGAGDSTNYFYNNLGQTITITNALGNSTHYTYDKLGRTASVTDARGNTTSYEYDALGRRVSVTDALLGVTKYIYDKNGNLLKTIDAESNSTSSTYDKTGRILTSVDGVGNTTSYTYNNAGQLLNTTNALTGVTSYTYDPNGNITSITDPMGYVTQYSYDALNRNTRTDSELGAFTVSVFDDFGQLISSADALGNENRYEYDIAGQQISATDPRGATTASTYNLSGQITSLTYLDGGSVSYNYNTLGQTASITMKISGSQTAVTRYAYDAVGRQASVTNALGEITSYVYNEVGNIVETKINGTTVSKVEYDELNRAEKRFDGNNNPTVNAFDKVGNVIKQTDREGNETDYEYFGNYALKTLTDALGHSEEYTYDVLGRRTEITDKRGNSTNYEYDANGNVTKLINAESGATAMRYDRLNRMTSITSPRGNVTSYVYDVVGNVTSSTDAYNSITKYDYDPNGNLIREENREREVTEYTYDSMNRRLTRLDPLDHYERWTYDLAGSVVTFSDLNGNITRYNYDLLGRISSETDAVGAKQEFEYNAKGELTALIVDGGGNVRAKTSLTYDGAGNMLTETSPLNFVITREYDKNGNVTTKTLPNGKTATYEYDACLQVIKSVDDDTSTFTYDPNGNVLTATNAAGTVTFDYDNLNRVISVSENGYTYGYEYDADGNRSAVIYPDGEKALYEFDKLDKISKITEPQGETTTYRYDYEGRVMKVTYPDGASSSYDYNRAGMLMQQRDVADDGVAIRDLTYAYDDKGNVTGEIRRKVYVDQVTEAIAYTYDAADRLISAEIGGTTTNYTLDKAGNSVSDGQYSYTYDAQNRIISSTDGTSYTYDGAGNLIKKVDSDGTTNYTYNARGQLLEGALDDGQKSEYIYNALGVRVGNIQTRENENVAYANSSLNNGSHRIPDYILALEDFRAKWQRSYETEVGTVVQNDFEVVDKTYLVDYTSIANRDLVVIEAGSWIAEYVYYPNGTRLSAKLDYADGTARGTTNAAGEFGENPASDFAALDIEKVWYRGNYLGSSLYCVDADGETLSHTIYDPWGEPITSTYTDTNFSGIEALNNYASYCWDETLELYYAQARMYDPVIGRFTTQDPIKDGANWYLYVAGNPVNAIDVTGLEYMATTLEYGCIGDDVRILQRALKYLGHFTYSGGITGAYFEATLEAVKLFKTAHMAQNHQYVSPAQQNGTVDQTVWEWLVQDVLDKWLKAKNWGNYFYPLVCKVSPGATNNSEVRVLQAGLIGVGLLAIDKPTGNYADKTQAAVKEFTGSSNVMDQTSWNRLRRQLFRIVIGFEDQSGNKISGNLATTEFVQKTVKDFFIGKGFSAAQAAGVMGNAEQESSWNPLARSNGSQYWGLFQINKTLATQLDSKYKEAGLDITKYGYSVSTYQGPGAHTKISVEDMAIILDIQLNYIYGETPSGVNWITPLSNAETSAEAAEVFLVRFEGAKSTNRIESNRIKFYKGYIDTYYQEAAKRRENAAKY